MFVKQIFLWRMERCLSIILKSIFTYSTEYGPGPTIKGDAIYCAGFILSTRCLVIRVCLIMLGNPWIPANYIIIPWVHAALEHYYLGISWKVFFAFILKVISKTINAVHLRKSSFITS